MCTALLLSCRPACVRVWLSFTLALALLVSPVGAQATSSSGPVEVEVGAWVSDVMALDMSRHTYVADFYLWFRWSDPEFNPAETFEFVNASDHWAHTVEFTYDEPDVLPDGRLYQVLHVQGGFHRPFPLRSYPFDRQVLTIAVEDNEFEVEDVVYIADTVGLDEEVVLPGLIVGEPRIRVDSHYYPTNFGDVRLPGESYYSRATIEIPVRRPTFTHIVKVLGPIACVMLCSFLMFLLPAPETRVTVGITSLLTTVALALNQNLPNVGYLILLDRVYIASYAFIVLGLGLNVYAIFRNKGDLPRYPTLAATLVYTVAVAFMIGEAMVSG